MYPTPKPTDKICQKGFDFNFFPPHISLLITNSTIMALVNKPTNQGCYIKVNKNCSSFGHKYKKSQTPSI